MTETPAAPTATPGVVADPFHDYNFKLSIQGVVQGHFTRLDGMGIRIPRILYREAGENSLVRSVPGPVEYATVTLRYGVTTSTEMIDWLFDVVNGRVVRKNVTVFLLDDTATRPVREWQLLGAWPCEWYGAPLDAMGQDLAVESLALAYDRLEMAHAGPSPA
jgi:phage tail-like protein